MEQEFFDGFRKEGEGSDSEPVLKADLEVPDGDVNILIIKATAPN